MDSNSRSHRGGKGYGEPLQASIAVSDLNLKVAPRFVPPSDVAAEIAGRDRIDELRLLRRQCVR